MVRPPIIVLAFALVCAAVAACGGGAAKEAAPSAVASATETVTRGTVATTVLEVTATPVATEAAAAATVSGSGAGSSARAGNAGEAPPPPPPPPPPPVPAGRTWSFGEAQALLNTAPIGPGDLPSGWTISTDTVQDNPTAAAADPRAGASFERCGRLLSRLVVNAPAQADLVSRYIGGESVSFFSLLTAYATEAGAADCAIESAVRFSEPGELAKAFGSVFVKTTPVVVNTTPYPQIGDGSIAWTLSGKTAASGLEVNLTILLVAFRKGNTTAAIGSAAASTPSVEELTPLVNTVLARISAAQ